MINKRVIPFAVPLLLSLLISNQVFADDMYGEIVTDDIVYDNKVIQVDKPAVPDDGGSSTGIFIIPAMLKAFFTIICTSSCGDVTITIPSTGRDWKTVSGTSPVPGGMSTNK